MSITTDVLMEKLDQCSKFLLNIIPTLSNLKLLIISNHAAEWAVYLMHFSLNSKPIIQILGHCIDTWYAMSRSLVKLTGIETSRGMARQ